MLLNVSHFHLCPRILKHNRGQHCLRSREAMRAQTIESCPTLTSPTEIAVLIWSFNWHIVLDIFIGTTWHFGPRTHYYIKIKLEWLACLSPRAFMTSLCWECLVLSARHFEILSFLKALRNNKWFYIRCRMRTKKKNPQFSSYFLLNFIQHLGHFILSEPLHGGWFPSWRMQCTSDWMMYRTDCPGCVVPRGGVLLAIIYAPKIFLRLIFVLCVLLFGLCVCSCTVCVPCPWRPDEGVGSSGTECTVVSHCVGAEDQT